MYDPSVGRFLSRDIYPYDFANPVELNRYGYARSNPVNFSDPSGYMAETAGTYRTSVENKPALTMIGNFNYRLFGGVVLGTLLAMLVGDPTDVEQWEDVAQDVQDWLRDEWWNGDPPRGPQYPRWARLILAVVATATFFSPLATKNAIEGTQSQFEQTDYRVDQEIERSLDSSGFVYFIHATTTALWNGMYQIPSAIGGGDFGQGFYTFADSN